MSWVLAILAAGGALFFLFRARRQAGERFDEVLKAREEADKAVHGPKGGGLDRDA